MSLWFYGYFNIGYLPIICASILVNYGAYRFMNKKGIQEGTKKLLLTLALLFNVGLIFYFKYFDFFIDNINHAFNADFVLRNITLPLGISFFTFQQISFIVDAYRGEAVGYSFIEYALFVSFFPQLVAGPIVLHSELVPQFRDEVRRHVNFDNLSQGIMMFARGLAKKILIADTFGGAVDIAISKASEIAVGEGALTRAEIIILMLSYTFQIYFDFSGYSDMATGLGQMFNLNIPMNFNSPYKALSVADFWKRWHMTLTRFLTTYIYIPLGGNRKGKARTYLNTMIVFLVSGIWHGANWTFILWGILHGIAQCFNKLTSGIYKKIFGAAEGISGVFGKVVCGLIKAVQWIVTFAFLNVTWLLFRADSVTMWVQILKRLFVLNLDVREDILENFRIPKFRYVLQLLRLPANDNMTLWAGLIIIMLAALLICLLFPNNYERTYKRNVVSLVFTWVILVICIISLSSVSTFLYFNF
ncbi:D-alanyl-lipoteichoic acid acyltransferase DltB, MBOAT superfamily [Butyrivibrio sp. INlla18]|uniref:MBOAT family O-acyltransferase n=1 Tax=Butyrivibrio sp. INlla18 TaxID=1520806 RepID=UPI00088BA012|nr:MBOAT family O-acyltransferase [Butyrivibrio sp. INlla18]SDA42775.1 D-alanyl-lipoteichoic acid acyltransferase DltB, MBOAT superfamily [Butyrivibrio sp. INlla18]